MMLSILPIVEGFSEVASVRVLLQRVFTKLGITNIQIAVPYRVHRTAVVAKSELERAIKHGIKTRPNVAAVLVLLDADDD